MKIKNINQRLGQRGVSSLIGVLALIMLSGLLGTTVLNKVGQESIAGAMDLPELESKAGTFAGIEYALAQLSRGNDPDTDGEVIALTGNTGFSVSTNPQSQAGFASISASATTSSGIRNSTQTKDIQALYSRNCVSLSNNLNADPFPDDYIVNGEFVVNSANCNVNYLLWEHMWVDWQVCGDHAGSCNDVANIQQIDPKGEVYENLDRVVRRVIYKRQGDAQWLELYNNATGADASRPGQVRGGDRAAGVDIPNQLLEDGTYSFKIYFNDTFYNSSPYSANVRMAVWLGFKDNSFTDFSNNSVFYVAEDDGEASGPVNCKDEPAHPDCAVAADEEGDGTGVVDCEVNPENPACPDINEGDGLPADCDSDPDLPECAADPVDDPDADCAGDPSKCGNPCAATDNPDLCDSCLALLDQSDACKPYKDLYPAPKACSDLGSDAEIKACQDCVNDPDGASKAECDPYKGYVIGGQEGGGSLE